MRATPSNDVLIRATDVGKAYPVAGRMSDRLATLRALLTRRSDFPHFKALEGVSLEVMRGQSLGLIGENGAGKSTLLKILAGVIQPSSGRIEVRGKVGALLELGAGFHPEYTGRENIFLSGALMGIDRPALNASLERILDFADIGPHIDQPIRNYSSGMIVRLGFAIATVLDPDLLLTDEVLAVGDESFQRKCMAWMDDYLSRGGTLVLCSHSMYHIKKMCSRAAWIHHGRLHRIGPAEDVTREYLTYHDEKALMQRAPAARAEQPAGGVYEVRELRIDGHEAAGPTAVPTASCMRVEGAVYSPDGRPPQVHVGIVRLDGTPVYGVTADMDGHRLSEIGERLFGFALEFPDLPLLPGRYVVRAHAMDPEGLRLFDQVERIIDVTGASRELGLVRLAHRWLPARSPD